jgi:hypothetical protein
MFDAVTGTVSHLMGRKPRSHIRAENLIPGANKAGGPIKLPEKGAKGMAGVRADLLDGTLTVREFTMLSLREISIRYRVAYPGTARYCRNYVAKHGAT